jgi:hypothetical protein
MRANRVVIVVAALAVASTSGGCTPRQRLPAGAVERTVAPAAHHRAPAPANPDLETVMERFYQQIEGAHWPFAYAMLSPRYRAALRQDQFVARYDRFADLDVSLRRFGDRVVVATIAAKERGSAAPARHFEERTTLAWDGEDWRIDDIVRRDVKPAGTR